MTVINKSQIIDQLSALSLIYTWQRFAAVKTSIFVTQRRTVKKLRARPSTITENCTDNPNILQRLSVSLCNPCTPQYSIPPEDEFLNFYENLSPQPPLPSHTLSLTPSPNDRIDVNNKSEDNVLFSKCIIPVTLDSQDNASEDEFLIEKENNVVDLCSDTSLDEEPTFIQLNSTTKSSSKNSIRKRELSKSNRDRISSDMFQSFNETVFNNQLPEILSISWNNRLVKTAGLTHCKEIKEAIITRQASIEISVKVSQLSNQVGLLYHIYSPRIYLRHDLGSRFEAPST